MMVVAVTVVLWALVALFGWLAWRRHDGTFGVSLASARTETVALIPRLALGVIGSGFIASALPQDQVVAWFGAGSGMIGVAAAGVAGALTPGGPVVGFALGTAALKAGAGVPQVAAFVTGWSLYALNRMVIWEVPVLPARFVALRLIVSLPFPFLAAGLAALWTGS